MPICFILLSAPVVNKRLCGVPDYILALGRRQDKMETAIAPPGWTTERRRRSMTFRGLFSVILAGQGLCAFCTASAAEELVLAEKGRTAYRIVVADDASASIKHGAEELQTFFARMTGARLPIVSDRGPAVENEIIIGPSARLREAGISIGIPSLGAEGYRLKTVGKRLAIAGGPQRGALYGVYGLLEDHCGCRWFTPDVSRIPRVDRLALPALDERIVPKFEYREIALLEGRDADWSARNRLNAYSFNMTERGAWSTQGNLEFYSAKLTEKYGGRIVFGREGQPYGWFCHTFYRMVPPDTLFDPQPEYFSMVNGKRLRDPNYGQLCCTNEEVIRRCIKEVLAAMKAEPDAQYFSVSQCDTFPEAPNYCQCERCQELARREESQMAPVLMLVNRVAEAVEREFPRNTVETLAYRWTRKPPKTLRPRKNVVIRLCTAECCFLHPMETCDYVECRRFREDLKAWSRTGARFWVWNYVTSFGSYLLPYPSQRLQGANIRLFRRMGAKGVFQQDAYSTRNSELAALGGYMMAKLLWNPDYDENKARDEFLAAYYGAAAEQVRAYLQLLEDRVRKENVHYGIDAVVPATPASSYLADDLLLKADRLWETAEQSTAAESALQRRVRIARLSVDYAIAERARLEIAGKLPANPQLKALAQRRFEMYTKTLTTAGIRSLGEGTPLDAKSYRAGLAAALGIPAK
jgi:hypothetical protein